MKRHYDQGSVSKQAFSVASQGESLHSRRQAGSGMVLELVRVYMLRQQSQGREMWAFLQFQKYSVIIMVGSVATGSTLLK